MMVQLTERLRNGVRLSTCRGLLALIWMVGFFVLALLVYAQTMVGHYGDKVQEAWSWLLPTVIPTLALILGLYVAQVRGDSGREKEQVHTRVGILPLIFFALLSTMYLGLVLATILFQPFLGAKPEQFIQAMGRANLLLGPLQGLVSLSIGAFFLKKQEA